MEPWNLSSQSLKHWSPIPFTLTEMKQLELTANVVMAYRAKSDFLTSPCWMDEWALGYFCALRDAGIINNLQWAYLCSAFQPENLSEQKS